MTALGKDPVQQKRPSLGASFNLKRTAVADVPSSEPTPEAATPEPSTPPRDEEAATETALGTQAEAQDRPRYQAPASPGDPGKADKGLTLRMPKSLYDRFKARKEREGISYPNLMFTAVSKTHKRLPELLATSTIDLAKDKLCIQGEEVPFLGEADIPKDEEAAAAQEPTIPGPAGTSIGQRSGVVMPPGETPQQQQPQQQQQPSVPTQQPPNPAAQAPAAPAPNVTAAHVDSLVAMGATREQAVQALQAAEDNVDVAAGLIFF